MTTFEITFTFQIAADVPSERITHIGGLRSDGSQWLIEQQIAIRAIESKTWEFFVTFSGERAQVLVSQDGDQNKFLLAIGPDGSNLLMALPQTPPLLKGDDSHSRVQTLKDSL